MSINPNEGKHFEDIWVYINNLEETDFMKLNAINNTRYPDFTFEYSDYKDLIKGHGRIISYTSDDKNSTILETNEIYMI